MKNVHGLIRTGQHVTRQPMFEVKGVTNIKKNVFTTAFTVSSAQANMLHASRCLKFAMVFSSLKALSSFFTSTKSNTTEASFETKVIHNSSNHTNELGIMRNVEFRESLLTFAWREIRKQFYRKKHLITRDWDSKPNFPVKGSLKTNMRVKPCTMWPPTEPFKLHKLESGPSTQVSVNRDDALHYYKQMYTIRRMETAAGNMYKEKIVRGFCHLYSGQV
ncbi:unnamed protein product, partial [Timema podura]|nr:unnamed protein product [Timema podura]